MGLVDLKTNLKSLRYGKDRPFAGSSNQPYVTRDIDVKDSEVGRTGGPDFLLRGGTLIPRRIGNDVSRMTQMFFDLKSPNGILFTAKQNVLGLTSTNFKGGYTPPKLRERNQNLSGIAKVTDAIGTFAENLNANFNVYNPLSTIAQTAGGFLGLHLEKQGLLPPILGPAKYLDFITDGSDKRSRILSLKENKLTTRDNLLYEYQGGPGSINGIGKTRILKGESTNLDLNIYQNKGFLPYEDLEELSNKSPAKGEGNTEIFDFRQEINGTKVQTLNYSRPESRLEQRVNLGDPGRKGADRTNYQEGTGKALDELNALSLYKGPNQDNTKPINDFVKFRIGVIDNKNPNQKTYMHFRAFLDTLNDSYTSQWNSEQLMGRGENFYRFNNFTRTVSLGWTVAAQSKQELIPMYQKLNYLASSLAPDYTDIGYMAGNLVTLTLGGWFYEQPGIITSMTLDVPQESPWEIAIPVSGSNDSSVKELPHIVKVTGVQFIPIQKFTPRIQRNEYNGEPDGVGDVTKFGKERYLALANGSGAKYNNYDS